MNKKVLKLLSTMRLISIRDEHLVRLARNIEDNRSGLAKDNARLIRQIDRVLEKRS